jgi:hypothetical protein
MDNAGLSMVHSTYHLNPPTCIQVTAIVGINEKGNELPVSSVPTKMGKRPLVDNEAELPEPHQEQGRKKRKQGRGCTVGCP